MSIGEAMNDAERDELIDLRAEQALYDKMREGYMDAANARVAKIEAIFQDLRGKIEGLERLRYFPLDGNNELVRLAEVLALIPKETYEPHA